MSNIITNPTRPIIVTDVDDVLLNWIDGFRVFCEDRLEKKICASGPTGWDMSDWIGIPDGDIKPLIERFNLGEGHFFAGLPAFPDAKEALEYLRNEGFRLHVVTSCSSNPVTISQRVENLESVFGDMFASIECLDLGVSKAPYLAKLPRGIWVEDNHDNGIHGADIGHKTYMMRRSHNRSREADCVREDLSWVDTWHDILRDSGLR